MLHRYLVCALLVGAAHAALAQTSPLITRADMPVPTDTLRQSTATPVLPAGAPPLSQRGANQTWNYGALVATAQNVARFTAVPSQLAYTLTFNSVLSGSNRATVAAPQSLPIPPGIALPITDPYQFFNASNADFRSVGYGGTLAGAAVPVTYASAAQQDVIYRFPLSFASQPDSSNSFFSINVPGTGYLSQRRKRVNKVDAWGNLTTPFGTFPTVRVVTRIEDHDSIVVAGINQAFDLPVTREYKWLAAGQHVPLLTITTTLLAGQEVISQIEYRDIYRRLLPLGTRAQLPETAVAAYPNPLRVGEDLHLTLPAAAGLVQFVATDLTGRVLFRAAGRPNMSELVVPAGLWSDFRGVALLRVQTETGTAVRRVVRQ